MCGVVPTCSVRSLEENVRCPVRGEGVDRTVLMRRGGLSSNACRGSPCRVKPPVYRAFLLPCPLRHKDLPFPSFAPEAGFFRSSMLTPDCGAIDHKRRYPLKASQQLPTVRANRVPRPCMLL